MEDLIEGGTDYFYHVPEAKLELDNLGNEVRITAGTRRSIQRYRDYLHRRFMQQSSDSFLFSDEGKQTTNYTHAAAETLPLNANSDRYSHASQDRFQYYLQEKESNRTNSLDLRVLDFVDPTKQLIRKAQNSKLFRSNKLATNNWSLHAPLPLMDSKFFLQVGTKDVLEPGTATASMISRSIFTPKYGVSTRDTLRESSGILFFSKDIDLDYQSSLRHLRQFFPNLVSPRYYVPFVTFVQALRRTRVKRTRQVRVNTRCLLRILLWVAVLTMLTIFTTVIMLPETSDAMKNFAMTCLIVSPGVAFLIGVFDKP